MYVNCPICGAQFKKRGLHHHIQRKHEGKQVKYHRWSEQDKRRISLSMKAYIEQNSEEYKSRKLHLGRPHTDESKEKLRQKALASKHRRLKKNTINYNGITLDSSWELALAKRLDKIKVQWIRPEPLQWIDNQGYTHNYFPDFYLTDYDLYLDPKNPHAVAVQKEKLDIILNMDKYKIVILTTLEQCETYSPQKA